MRNNTYLVGLTIALGLALHSGVTAADTVHTAHAGIDPGAPAASSDESRSPRRRNRIAPPAGYDSFIVFLENGVFDPRLPHPEVPGCFGFFCSGDYYHVTVRGRTLAEVLAIELEAKVFFVQRYGVDVDDPDNMGRLFFRRYYRDPRSNLNAFLVSGRSVPPRGWQVDDGGWQVIFTSDFTLGGEFSGMTVPAGTMLTWGEYLITPDGGRAREPIVLSHRSARPPAVRVPPEDPVTGFQRELYRGALDDPANDWGSSAFPHQGLDEGIEFNASGMGGEVKANSRHVLTFNDDGGV